MSELIIDSYELVLEGKLDEDKISKINSYLSERFLEESKYFTIYDFILHELS